MKNVPVHSSYSQEMLSLQVKMTLGSGLSRADFYISNVIKVCLRTRVHVLQRMKH